MIEWSSDTLWSKAQVYTKLAFEADPSSPLFPLLASFSLEMLGKSALSNIHPALIADPRQEGAAILYAFGVPTKDPKTIVAKTVFNRLRQIVPEFNDDDESYCVLMAERRNKELHTGELSYQNYGTGAWLAEYYRVVKVLCVFLGRDLSDLLGPARAAEAAQITLGEAARVKADVSRRIADRKRAMADLHVHELQQRRIEHEPKNHWRYQSPGWVFRSTPCPSCESAGSLHLKETGERPPEIVEDAIYVDTIYSPREFSCAVCGLKLSGTQELRVAALADEIIRSSESTPTEYFDIPTPEPDWSDYGND